MQDGGALHEEFPVKFPSNVLFSLRIFGLLTGFMALIEKENIV